MAARQKFVTFFANGIFFGVAVGKVQEVLRQQEITPVPLAPRAIPGVINLRGQIIPAIDLSSRLGLPESGATRAAMCVVLRTSTGAVSLLVDEIGDVEDLTTDLSEEPPETLRGEIRRVTRQVYKLQGRLLLELDTDKVVRLVKQSESNGTTALEPASSLLCKTL